MILESVRRKLMRVREEKKSNLPKEEEEEKKNKTKAKTKRRRNPKKRERKKNKIHKLNRAKIIDCNVVRVQHHASLRRRRKKGTHHY